MAWSRRSSVLSVLSVLGPALLSIPIGGCLVAEAGLPSTRENDARGAGAGTRAGSENIARGAAPLPGSADDPGAGGQDAGGSDVRDDEADEADEAEDGGPAREAWGAEGTTPALAHHACQVWTDCGPHFSDPNSGFDCVASVCVCDASGGWAAACAEIGGVWGPEDCFCFVGARARPSAHAEPPAGAAADIECWWTWREACEPDRWIDRSYNETVCYDEDECYREYVEDGYYEDGACTDRWIKRCTDGFEYP